MVVVVTVLIWESFLHWPQLAELGVAVLPWVVVTGLADLAPVPIWGSVQLMMSFPVLLAAAFVFPPYVAGLVSFVGTVDTREFSHEIPLLRGLFNRSNVTASVMVASALFRHLDGDVTNWPAVALAAFVALVADVAINASLVILGTHLLTELGVATLFRRVYGGTHPWPFLVAYACFGLLALMLASLYAVAGGWGLIAFAIPLLLARMMFTHWRRLGEATDVIEAKEKALSAVTRSIADERKEERLAVAAEIHDEVLPPLYKVHLMGQVVRNDLATGHLLDLEADVPDLLRAVEAADAALRDMVRDLRRSAIGPGGLLETLRLLARDAEARSTVRVHVDLTEVGGSPLTQLLLYQLAREAVANALKHAEARNVVISLHQEDGAIRLRVSDDGRGFDPLRMDSGNHFGLQLSRERVELAGGVMAVDTSPQAGTQVVYRLPVD
ncbi:MAG TPA: ATP-binding protein [Actinomycetota bacterium]|nr:ATP-binding protein [Actinomycetota bacterium]